MKLRDGMRGLILLLTISFQAFPSFLPASDTREKEALPPGTPIIWRNPVNIRTRNLFYGQGGEKLAPRGPFRFIKETKEGTHTQFVLEDKRGIKWRVKLGKEAQPETVATHLLWAVGYFSDPTYYLPKIKIKGIEAMLSSPPEDSVSGNFVYGARFEPEVIGENFVKWKWFDNPFIGTKEFNGLRVMMALINNWDLKDSNNRIAYDRKSRELRYMIHDIGAGFGKTGGFGSRSKNDPEDYIEEDFIKKVKPETVDLVLKSRPPWVLIINPVYFQERSKLEKIGKDIPRDHARWIGQLLSQLSDRQIQDAFRAAGYNSQEVRLFSSALRSRIIQLKKL
jgi:hypothetical protein